MPRVDPRPMVSQMNRRDIAVRIAFAVAWVGLVGAPMVGCASGPDQQQPADDQIVGQPPEEESEDYEFAPPPEHPGQHGDIQGDAEPVEDVETASEPGVVTEAEIEQLKRYGPAVVMQHVDARPAYGEDDEFIGFRIEEASETARQYLEPDIEVGDVVTHVNLVELEQPDDYMEAWESLEGADEVRFDVIRDGQQEDVVLDVQ